VAENKTRPNRKSIMKFLEGVTPVKRREDGQRLLQIMSEITGEEPKMWGTSIIGFGSYHYQYESGREGDSPMTGFSPRKASLSVYIMGGFPRHESLMSKLGKYKTGKSCLYINKLEDVDEKVLRQLIKASWSHMKKTYH